MAVLAARGKRDSTMTEVEEHKGLASAFDSPTFGQDGSFRLDKPVGSASISPCGRDVVLASRQGLHIIDLDSPWSPPRHLAHHTPWEVADVQWSPFAARDYWVVSTSNQKALVWNLALANARSSVEHVLHGHSRAITDINFSAHYPDILATCAVDSFVHCWDLRHPSRPAMTFCDWFAGATQVKWSRQNPHILASSHDKFLRIWDDRKGAFPLRSIEAHATKIYGVDWSRTEANNLVTCSLDRTIKFWNYTKHKDEPDRVLHTPFPVWRARHTPFGFGLLAMPQRGDHDLHLYDRRIDVAKDNEHTVTAVHRFEGHDDQVKEFLWRPRGNVIEDVDDREFQLVSWGTDRILRLQNVDDRILGNVGYKKGMQVKRSMNITRKNAVYKTFREDPSTTGTNASGGEGPFNGAGALSMGSAPTIGMSRAPVPFIGGYGNGDFMSPMIGKRMETSNEMDPISWMRGVKIGKREPSPSSMHQSVSSILSLGLKTDPTWDAFESLGEEITYVGDKFTKVKFEEIDMQRRRIQVSLSGPWGPEKSSTYLKARIDFPTKYPSAAPPSFTLEQTASLSDQITDQIYVETKSIASSFMSRQKSSLEAILQYLLGERNLEESLLWLEKRHESVDLESTQDLDLSSSDEEDESLGRYAGDQIESMDASDPMIAVSNARYNIPLPKACGALWAEDGRLVCFFPPKQEKEPSLLDFSVKASDRSSGSRKKMFDDFGRLHNDPARQKRGASTLETIESGDSDPENSSTFSSSSSSCSDNMGLPRHHYMPSMAWRSDFYEAHQGPAVDGSQKSSGDTGFAKSTVITSGNYVSIHDFTQLLPAKKHLAEAYTTHDGSSGCAHNSRIARESGDLDLAHVWSFIELIIQERVPLVSKIIPGSNAPAVTVARRSVSRLKPKDSAIDLSFDAAQEDSQPGLRGSVKWGDHPLGRRWFVDSLFRHFEQLADIQMLAMLACVLDEPRTLTKRSGRPDPRLSLDQTSRDRRSFATGYYPSEEVARNHFTLLLPSELSTQVDLQKMASGPQSANSSIGPLSDLSTGGTPPSLYKPSRTSPEHRSSQSTSLSTSPEHYRHAHRSNANLSAFAAFSRPFTFASAASSPPSSYPKKRSSPVGSYPGNLASTGTWSTSGLFSRSSAITEDAKPALSLSVSDTEEDVVPIPKKPVFKTKLKNQDRFRNDGYASIPLLDPSKEWRYRAYREAYAHLLYIWDMPVARAEILNHNRPLQPDASAPFAFAPKITDLFNAIAGANLLNSGYNTENSNPVFRDHCPSCSTLLLPSQTPSRRCQACSKLPPPPLCLLCNTSIRGLSSPCPNCGHVLHAPCRQLLAQASFDECPSGCGCICTDHTSMPLPPLPTPSAAAESETARDEDGSEGRSLAGSPAVTVTGDEGANEQEQLGWKEQGWDDVAYESLARNLRPRAEGRGRG